MRISPKTYPVYVSLSEGRAADMQFDPFVAKHFGIEESYTIARRAQATFREAAQNKSVRYVTDAFLEVMDKTSDKLSDAMNQDIEGNRNSGNIMYEAAVFLHRIGIIMHRVESTPNGKVCDYFMLNRTGITGYLRYHLEDDKAKNKGYLSGNFDNCERIILGYFRTYIMLLYFIDRCEIETVVVKPYEKAKVSGDKFYNEYGKHEISVLDAKWYRELIINSPYGVSGHLRFQPYGEGRTKRKLIWIAPYEKQGYHRKAKKENEELSIAR